MTYKGFTSTQIETHYALADQLEAEVAATSVPRRATVDSMNQFIELTSWQRPIFLNVAHIVQFLPDGETGGSVVSTSQTISGEYHEVDESPQMILALIAAAKVTDA
jgi:hypothetical protein